jgi:putative membrane protein
MGFIISFLIVAIVTAISLLIISKIPPLGVEVDNFGEALRSGIIFGILNGIAGFIFQFLGWPLFIVLTLGFSLLVSFLINVAVFGLTARLVGGFRLKHGIWSAVFGAIALSAVNGMINWLLGQFGVTVA